MGGLYKLWGRVPACGDLSGRPVVSARFDFPNKSGSRGPAQAEGLPHNLCRIVSVSKTKWHWAILPAAGFQPAAAWKGGRSHDWLPHKAFSSSLVARRAMTTGSQPAAASQAALFDDAPRE